MATYDQLMVYKHAYDLTVQALLITKKIDRAYKFTLGEKLNEACVEMLLCVYRINVVSEREQYFISAREQIEEIRILLRLMRDLKLTSNSRYSELNDFVESISKQLSGWHKSNKSNGEASSKSTQGSLF